MPSEDSYKKIEGEWKDFRFRRIQKTDWPAVFVHIANTFAKDEPTSKLFGWTQEYADDLNRVVEAFLGEGLSFIAEHIPTGKIAGARITFHHKPETSFDGITLNTHNAKLLVKLVGEIEGMADMHNKHGIDSWAEFFIASTDPDFRNQGLAGEFYDRSIEFLRSEGFKHALVVCSSPYTKLATKRRGFEQVARLDYDTFMDFENKPTFKKEDLTPEHFALLMLKTL